MWSVLSARLRVVAKIPGLDPDMIPQGGVVLGDRHRSLPVVAAPVMGDHRAGEILELDRSIELDAQRQALAHQVTGHAVAHPVHRDVGIQADYPLAEVSGVESTPRQWGQSGLFPAEPRGDGLTQFATKRRFATI